MARVHFAGGMAALDGSRIDIMAIRGTAHIHFDDSDFLCRMAHGMQ
jgi:hypothetical protein